jgi:hypothetical protein
LRPALMITAADADASPEICARRRAFPSPDEVVNGVEADQSHDDQKDCHEQPRRIRIKMPARRATSGVMWAMVRVIGWLLSQGE